MDINSSSTASFLDKTDWRKTIHRCLENCVRAEGTIYYMHTVQSLVSAFAANYPNFDAKQMTNKKIDELEKKYTQIWDSWTHINSGKRKDQKQQYKYYLRVCLCRDIFEYVKNLCASKRMLLWGTKSVPKGSQMGDE